MADYKYGNTNTLPSSFGGVNGGQNLQTSQPLANQPPGGTMPLNQLPPQPAAGGFLYGNTNTLPTSFTPPTTSTPIQSSTITNGSALNFPKAPTQTNPTSFVAGTQAATMPPPAPPASATPGMDAATSGDYTTDPNYQQQETNLVDAQNKQLTAQQNMQTQESMFNSSMESSGANAALAAKKDATAKYNALLADYNNTAAAYGTQIAQNEQKAMESGVPAVFYQGEQAAMQRTQQAVLNQKATLVGAAAVAQATASGDYATAEHLAEKTAEYKFADAQQKIDTLRDFVQMNQDNLGRAEKLAISKMEAQVKVRQERVDKQKENYTEALLQGIKTQYVNRNGKFYRTNDGKEYDSEAEFFADAGVKTFGEAYKKGLVSDITGDSIADRELVSEIRAKYYDAGINAGDTPESARAKMENSLIYRKETYNADLYKDSSGEEAPVTKDDADGNPVQWDKMTQEWVPLKTSTSITSDGFDNPAIASAKDKIKALNSLLTDPGLNFATGPNSFARDPLGLATKSGVTNNFIGGVEQFLAANTLDTLIAAKAQGATFGALSQGELDILRAAQSKLGTWRKVDEKGNIYYTATNQQMRAELTKAKEAAQKMVIQKSFEARGFTGTDYQKALKSLGSLDEVQKFIDSQPFSGVGGDTNEATKKVSAVPDGTQGGQCGRFVNKITGLGVGDSYASKMAKMDKSITRPEPGMVFTMPYGQYGHIGFIVGIQGDQAIVKDSNYGLDEKVQTHTIPISKMTGFRRV